MRGRLKGRGRWVMGAVRPKRQQIRPLSPLISQPNWSEFVSLMAQNLETLFEEALGKGSSGLWHRRLKASGGKRRKEGVRLACYSTGFLSSLEPFDGLNWFRGGNNILQIGAEIKYYKLQCDYISHWGHSEKIWTSTAVMELMMTQKLIFLFPFGRRWYSI